MTAFARTKAAKRRNRRAINNAARIAALKLKAPKMLGMIASAEMAIEDIAAERERRDAQKLAEKRAVTAWPCDVYHKRHEVTAEQHSAAQRLHAAWMGSGLNPWASGGDGIPNHGGPRTPGQGSTYVAYVRAVRAVGVILFPILAEVVIVGRPASAWVNGKRIDAGKPALHPREAQREGMITLKLALDALVAHYRSR